MLQRFVPRLIRTNFGHFVPSFDGWKDVWLVGCFCDGIITVSSSCVETFRHVLPSTPISEIADTNWYI